MAGKYAQLFTSNAVTTCKLLIGISQIQEEQEDEQEKNVEKPMHATLDPSRLLEIIRELPENLDLDLLQKLIEKIPEDLDEMGTLIEWVDVIDLSTIEATEEVTAMKEIIKSNFTLAQFAKVIKQDPDRLEELVAGEVEEIDGNSSIAELVEILA